MQTTQKIQRAKVGVSGSFFNQLMSNNDTIPVVGKGATIMHYSDRTCMEVIEVSKDGKSARLEYLDAEWDRTKPGGEGHQNWILKQTGRFVTVVWRNNAWRTKGTEFRYTKEFIQKHGDAVSFARLLTPEQKEAVYNGEVRIQNEVPGITEKVTVYNKIKILFGSKDYYYDWSF